MQVAEEFHASLDSSWPTRLCSREEASQVAVRLSVPALAERFTRLAKRGGNMDRIRARAIKLLKRSGQMCTPADGMSLWTYFQPERTVVITKSALANKDSTIKKKNSEGKKHRRAATSTPTRWSRASRCMGSM